MTITNNNYCVILAGGKGRRLWPCSREEKPKQFMDLFGVGRTQLQQTYDRFAAFLPKDNIYIVTNIEYRHFVEEQLPNVSDDHILAEPIHRNTAPSVAWASHRISHLNPNACIVVTPSDHAVINEKIFEDNIVEGLDYVSTHNSLLTMGVKPNRPEQGYGYIQIGAHSGIADIFKVKAFTEKPDREFAKMFMDSGEWYWNTGLFLSNVTYLRRCMNTYMPLVLRSLDAVNPEWTIEDENRYVEDHFSQFPNLSIDYGILEKSDNVFVMKCDFGWADLGTWHGIHAAISNTDDENVLLDTDAMLYGCKGNIIKLPKGRVAVIDGLEDYIVAESGNVLFICKKEDSSALVRKYVNEVQIEKGDEFV